MTFSIDKQSLDKLQRKLERELPREAKEEGRKLVKEVVTELRNKIKTAAPEDTGTLKKSLYTKVLRDRFGEPTAADVRVRTGKKAQATNRDGWYWKFIEYGTTKMAARPFVQPTLERFRPKLGEYFTKYRDGLAERFNK